VPTRLRADRDLPADVRKVFEQVVGAAPPGFFVELDRVLLVEVSQTVARCRRAERALAAEGDVVNGKPNAWLTVLRDSRHALANLLTKARLTPSTRYQPKEVRPGKVAPRLAIDWGLEDA
jgi:hypothetical protein